jgi:hypothetical protein
MRVKIKTSQDEMKATVRASQEKMEAPINSIESELEGAIKDRVENVLVSVDQWTHGLCEELNVKIEETQLGLQTSLDTRT